MQRKETKSKEERVALVDKVIMLEKLIKEKEQQINFLKNWLKQIQGGEK